METSAYKKKFYKLNQAIGRVIEDYSLVKFHPLDLSEEDSINDILLIIDNVLQYGEDIEPKEVKEFDDDDDDEQENRYGRNFDEIDS
jgi:hypothetical protein